MTYGYVTDPAQEFYLQLERLTAQKQRLDAERFATTANADTLATYNMLYPTSSAEVGIGMAVAGIPPGTAMADQLAYSDLQTRNTIGPVEEPSGGWFNGAMGILDEWVVNPIQGTVRWTFAAWDGLFQLAAGGAPIRAAMLAHNEGIPFAEAWKEQDPYIFEAIGGLLNFENVNLGSGFFPNSDVAPEVEQAVQQKMMEVEQATQSLPANERYIQRLEASPRIWREAIAENFQAQAEFGKPLTQLHYADIESVMFNMGGYVTPWSPGRIVSATIAEPGTKPFHALSGFLDFGAQVFLDPMDYVGGWAMKSSKIGRTIWGEAQNVANKADELFVPNVGKANRVGPGYTAAPENYFDYPGFIGPRPEPQYGPPKPVGGVGRRSQLALAPEYGPFAPERIPRQSEIVARQTQQDQALEIIEQVRPQIALPATAGQPSPKIVGEGDSPWWWSGTEPVGQPHVPNPSDPPQFFIDEIRRIGYGAYERVRGQKPRRVVAGAYEMDMPRMPGRPQKKLKILRRKEGSKTYWDITAPDGTKVAAKVDDPRFTEGTTRFRTLAEAQGVAEDYIQRGVSDLRWGGMTAEEFANSGEDMYLHLGTNDQFKASQVYGGKQAKYGQNAGLRGTPTRTVRREIVPGVKGPETPSTVKSGFAPSGRASNAKHQPSNLVVRVFGKTVDLRSADGSVEHLPEELIDVLARDKKIVTENGVRYLQGFGSDNMIDKFHETTKWMENNGVGKLIFDDDDVYIARKFIGGDASDPLTQIRYADLDGPRTSAIIDGAEPPTVREVDDFLTDLAETIKYQRQVEDAKYPLLAAETPPVSAADIPPVYGPPKPAELTPDDVADRFAEITDELKVDDFRTPKQIEREAARAQRIADYVREVDAAHAGPAATYPHAVRTDVNPNYVLRGKRASMFLDRLLATIETYQKTGNAGPLDHLLHYIESRHITVPNEVRETLLNTGRLPSGGSKFDTATEAGRAAMRSEIEQTFTKWLVHGGPHEIVLPGGTRFGRVAAGAEKVGVRFPTVDISDKPWLARRVAMNISQREINMVEQPSDFYQRVIEAMPHYNLQRGAKIEIFDVDGNATGAFVDVEDFLTRLRNLQPNRKFEAFDLMSEWSNIMFSSLVRDGNVDPRLAREASRWFKDTGEKALYDAERFGRIDITNNPKWDAALVRETMIGGLGPSLTADAWTGAVHLPDPRTLKRVANNTDTLGRIANSVALKKIEDIGPDGLVNGIHYEERTLLRYYDNVVTKVWKPFVLLRAAWTLRILIDDQMRMAAEGYSMFNHPSRVIAAALTRGSDWKSAFTKGTVDVFGVKFAVDDMDQMKWSQYFYDALMSNPDPKDLGLGSYGRKAHRAQDRGVKWGRVSSESRKRYLDGLTFETEHLAGSTLTKILAGSTADDPVAETVKWLQGRGPRHTHESAKLELANQVAMHRNLPDEVVSAIQAGDEKVLTDIVSRYYAALHHRLGGKVYLDNGKGTRVAWNMRNTVENAPVTGKAGWVVEEAAPRELLDWVSGSKAIDTDAQRAALRSDLGRYTDEMPDRFPDFVRGPVSDEALGTKRTSYDNAVRTFYDFFMTHPSDKLSRIPEFRRAYWEKIADLYPFMDDTLKAKVLELAPDSQVKRALEKAKRVTNVDGQLTSLDQADQLAKAHGLTMVEKTLFDLTNKRNISDSLRLVFPFVEAWGEFLTRWGRLMVWGDANIHTARRFQQVVEGARDSGFFYENDYGQEVFNYPAFLTDAQIKLHNTLNNIPGMSNVIGGDIDQTVSDNIQATGSVQSLNFASSVIPGFGPVFQLGAKYLMPEDPSWDWARRMLAPFGTEGDFVGMVSPAWVKRVMSAYGGQNDPQLQYTYTSTLIDVIRTKIDNGDFAGVTSKEEIDAVLEEAREQAKGILMVRAAATFWNPTSPTYKFEKADKNGMVWSYSNLGQAYYDLVQETDSETEAYERFVERFGFLPQAFIGGKTYSIVDRSTTPEGSQFERGNRALFDRYPSTAMFLDPTIDKQTDYDHAAFLNQLVKGEREAWTGEQFIYLQHDQLGDLWYDNMKRQAASIDDYEQRKAFLTTARLNIQEQYPYWNKPVPGKVQSVTNDEQMAEIRRMLNDPDLEQYGVLDAARRYESYREEVLQALKEYGATTIDGPSSQDTDAGRLATFAREWLRDRAEQLRTEYPQFGPMFDSVYAWEVDLSHDEPEPFEPELGFGDDPLQTLTGPMSPTEVKAVNG